MSYSRDKTKIHSRRYNRFILTITLTSINILPCHFVSLSGDIDKNITQHIKPIIQSIQIKNTFHINSSVFNELHFVKITTQMFFFIQTLLSSMHFTMKKKVHVNYDDILKFHFKLELRILRQS